MRTDQLLEQVINELKMLRAEVRGNKLATCTGDEAIELLGLNNKMILTHFAEEGYLNRRKEGRRGYIYYRSEVIALSEKIKSREIIVPSQKVLYA